jgi:hypothetical protein
VLSKHGLVETLVWNKRTGNIIGGHQRVAAMDALEGSNNYLLDVAQVDVDEKVEKELNIALNNPESQGEWDIEKLEAMFKVDKLDFEATGFDTADIYQMFGESPLVAQPQVIQELAEQYRKLRQKHQELAKGIGGRDDPNFYLVVVFPSGDDRKSLTDALGLPDNRFVDGRYLTSRLAATVPQESA